MPIDFIGQCSLELNFTGIEDLDFLKITVNDSTNWYNYDEQISIPTDCQKNVSVRIETNFYKPYDTSIFVGNVPYNISIPLEPMYLVQDTLELHEHDEDSEIEEVQDVLEKNNIQSSSELFSSFSAINMTSKSTGINKPIMRFFHSHRLTVLENNLPIRDHAWGMDHGLETGLSHIYSVNYATTSSPIYADYGALFINQDNFEQVKTGKVKLGYNHVNRNKNIGFTLPHKLKNLYINLSGDIEQNLNYRVPTDKYTYLGSYYLLNDKQLSNTGKRQNFVSLEIKKDEKFSFGMTNKWAKTGLFAGGLGISNSYALTNQRLLQLPYQTLNHIKAHAHYKENLRPETIFSSDIALQNNRRKEYEVPANHGYNPLSTDSLGVDLNFTNLDLLLAVQTHLDSSLCLTLQNASNIGQNETQGFDFIIPTYRQLENRLSIDLETIKNKKSVFNSNLSLKTKKYDIEQSSVTMYRGSSVIGDIETSKDETLNFIALDFIVTYEQRVGKNINSKVSLATAGRSPEINELTAFGVHHGSFRFEKGNRDLQNERNVNIQTMLEFNKNKLKTRWKAYWYEFQNYIYLTPSNKFATTTIQDSLIALPVTGQLYEYRQTKARMLGTEFDASYQIADWEWSFQGFMTYAHNLESGLPLPFISPMSIKNQFSYHKPSIGKKWKNLITTLEFINNSAQNRVDRNENKTPASFITNLSSSISYLNKKSRIDISIGIENLWNSTYYVHLSEYRILNIPEPSRNVYTRLSYNF